MACAELFGYDGGNECWWRTTIHERAELSVTAVGDPQPTRPSAQIGTRLERLARSAGMATAIDRYECLPGSPEIPLLTTKNEAGFRRASIIAMWLDYSCGGVISRGTAFGSGTTSGSGTGQTVRTNGLASCEPGHLSSVVHAIAVVVDARAFHSGAPPESPLQHDHQREQQGCHRVRVVEGIVVVVVVVVAADPRSLSQPLSKSARIPASMRMPIWSLIFAWHTDASLTARWNPKSVCGEDRIRERIELVVRASAGRCREQVRRTNWRPSTESGSAHQGRCV